MAPRDRTGGQPEVPPEVPPEYADAYLAAFHRALAEGGIVPVMRESEDPTTPRPADESDPRAAPTPEPSYDVVAGEVVREPVPEPAPVPPYDAEAEVVHAEVVDAEIVNAEIVDAELVETTPTDGAAVFDEAGQDEPHVERMDVWAFEPPEVDPDEVAPVGSPQVGWDFEAPAEPVEDPPPPQWAFEPPQEPDPDWEFEQVPEPPLGWAFEPLPDEPDEPDQGDGGAAAIVPYDLADHPGTETDTGRSAWLWVAVFVVLAGVLMVAAYFLGIALSGQ